MQKPNSKLNLDVNIILTTNYEPNLIQFELNV